MKYFIKTFGCQMNTSDSERIAGFLELHKLKPAESIKKANLVIFNTCGVRQSAEDRVYGQIHNLKKNNSKAKIILTGCLADRKDVRKRLKSKVDLFFAINDFKKLKKWIIVNCKLKISAQKNIPSKESINYLSTNPIYTNTHEAFVPVITGCNNFCAYCVVPYARGQEISRPTDEIIKEIINLVKKGYEKITLLGQNVNSYQFEIKNLKFSHLKLIENLKLKIKNSKTIYFPELLNYIAQTFPIVNFRFLTSHPKDFSNDLIKVIARNKNISREIHLPLQAGSNKILKAMNRPYTQKKYLTLIEKIRRKIPGAAFTTDVIVGFPGETKKDFQETVKVFKKVRYNLAYLNKYSPRPGTAACKLGNSISWKEKKRRERVLRELVRMKILKN